MGIYSPFTQGEIDGRKAGINSDDEIYLHTRKFHYEALKGEYLVGFGAGFVEGKQFREQLRKAKTPLSLQSKADVLTWVLEQRVSGFNYNGFISSVDDYINNQKDWDNREVDQSLSTQLEMLIQSNQWPMAINQLLQYYKTQFRLKAWMDFDQISKELQSIRYAKRRDNTIDTTPGLNQVKSKFEFWLKNHSVQ